MSLLKGLKIIDLSRVLAGPFATQILGDLGANILKIEEPVNGDETRSWGPPFFKGTSIYFISINRNKKIKKVNFRNSKQLKALLKLISRADVLIENFKTGHLKKFGLDYSSLKKINPRLIYISITGFGQTGPAKEKPGYDLLIQAMSGLMSITGPNAQTPTKVGMAVSDITTGLYAVIAILAAVIERTRTGKGQHCDISLYESQISWLCHRLMNYLITKKPEVALGNDHPTIVPYGVFRAKDRSFVLAVGNDKQFGLFCEALGVRWHLDKKFATNPIRVKNRQLLKSVIERHFKTKPSRFWIQLIEKSGVPVGPINTFKDLVRDPQLRSRNFFGKDKKSGLPVIKSPMRFSK
ncbi:MAG: CaiB/BaiF CoA-transferase family protein [Pseudomonadota bacterium]|nr:CaiB/BaiF CoA-transferase family protein [Pseudomonadota bacterium]